MSAEDQQTLCLHASALMVPGLVDAIARMQDVLLAVRKMAQDGLDYEERNLGLRAIQFRHDLQGIVCLVDQVMGVKQ